MVLLEEFEKWRAIRASLGGRASVGSVGNVLVWVVH